MKSVNFCSLNAGLLFALVLAATGTNEAAIDRGFLKDLLEIPSVTADIPAVNRAIDFTRARLEKDGIACRVETDAEGHRILWASTDGEKVADYVLAVHVDVVPAEASQFKARVEGDRIFARGAHDCKGNVAIACDVLRRLKGKASVGVIFAANEELGGSTTRVMVERGYRPRRMALVVDAGDYGVFYAQKGNCYITVRAKGKGGHSSLAFLLDNPIERLMKGYEEFRASWPAVPKDGWGDLVVPTVIGAGQAENAIPDTAEMVLNVRSVTPDAPERVIERLKKIKGFEVVKVRSTGRPMASDPNDPEIQRLFAERRSRWPDKKGELARMLAITDARHFADLKIPVVIIGSVGGNAHGRGEWGDMENMDENADSLVAFLAPCKLNDRLREKGDRPLVLAHRGGCGERADNVVSSFRAALDAGVRGFEFDIRFSRDRRLVVMHDKTIDRTTNGKGVVEAMDYADLRKFRVNRSDEPLPTLEEVLEVFKGRKDVFIELEMKAVWSDVAYTDEMMEAYCRAISDTAKRMLEPGTFSYTACGMRALEVMRAVAPQAPLGLIMIHPLDAKGIAEAKRVGCVTIAPIMKGSTKEMVDAAHAAGLSVNLWHAENLALLDKAKALGADRCTSNYPVRVLNEINQEK